MNSMAIQAGLENGLQQAFVRLGQGRRLGEAAYARNFIDRIGARPLRIGSLIVGLGLAVGAAAAARRRPPPASDVPEEIVARALCREDPDTPTSRGPLWTGYRKDARRVRAALRAAELLTKGA